MEYSSSDLSIHSDNGQKTHHQVIVSPSVSAARLCFIGFLATLVAVVATLLARFLTMLIGLITNLAYYGRLSTDFSSPEYHQLGWLAVIIPVVGGIIVGLIARYGSKGIRGHGIPEAMEQVLLNQSRIPPRLTLLKPLSAAIAIGTGGPFGAEGPIIATGGSLGSFTGQILKTTARERKILLASGAAAGMAATFGCPVSAVILAIELLLFEISPMSLIPVSLASATAAGMRIAMTGFVPMFEMPPFTAPGAGALAVYGLLGCLLGICSVYITRLVYLIEDLFARLPLHWMWWPALGSLAVGLVGLIDPRTLGVGYENIQAILSSVIIGWPLVVFFLLKLTSWAICLGSGTSGGTLAPLFTIGGGIGSVLAMTVDSFVPSFGVDPGVGALVGMAAIFAGASRAPLASVVFAFETTLQPAGLLPLLLGCTTSYMVSCFMMKNSIMTEKIARRGVRIPVEFTADYLDRVTVAEAATNRVVTLTADQTLSSVSQWFTAGGQGSNHHGFPVIDPGHRIIGVVTRHGLSDAAGKGKTRVREAITRAPVTIASSCSLRNAVHLMLIEGVNRLIVTEAHDPERVFGILSRSDIILAHQHQLDEHHQSEISIDLRTIRFQGRFREMIKSIKRA